MSISFSSSQKTPHCTQKRIGIAIQRAFSRHRSSALLLCLLAAPTLQAADIQITGTAPADVCGNSTNTTTGDCNSTTSAPGKTVEVSGSGSVNGSVHGGYEKDYVTSNAHESRGNTAKVDTSGTVDVHAAGGWVEVNGDASAKDNKAILSNGTVGELYGGYANGANSDVTGNRVEMSGGTVDGDVFGGIAWGDKARISGNHVEISGGVVNGSYIRNQSISDYGLAEASQNSIRITGGMMRDSDVLGGWAASFFSNSSAVDNRVEIDGQGATQTQAYRIYGGYATTNSAGTSATVTNNFVKISGNTSVESVFGAEANSRDNAATASGNRVEMSGGTVRKEIYGGSTLTDDGTATTAQNRVDFSGGTATTVYGGGADASAGSAETRQNHVEVSGGQIIGSAAGGFGKSASGAVTVTENSFGMSSGQVDTAKGGYATSTSGAITVTKNSFGMSGGQTSTAIGGHATSASGAVTITENRVNITSGTAGAVYGGDGATKSSGSGDVSKNHISILGGQITGNTIGGRVSTASGKATASGNEVSILGGTAKDVYGADSTSSTGAAEATGNRIAVSNSTVATIQGGKSKGNTDAAASNNTITISGSSVTGSVYGGNANATKGVATSTNNTLNLEGAVVFGGSSQLYGGFTGGTGAGDKFSGNTLNLRTTGTTTVSGLSNFENLNFYLPSTLKDGDTILRVSNTANLTNGSGVSSQVVTIGLGANQNVSPGDKIKLIDAKTLTSLPAVGSTVTGTSPDGIDTEWKISADSKVLSAFMKRMETTGDLSRPNGLRVRSSATEDVILKVGGTLDAGSAGLTVDNRAGGGVSVDIGSIDASASDATMTLHNTSAWNGTDGVRVGTLNLGHGHGFTLNGGGSYAVDTYNIHGTSSFSGNLNAAGSAMNFTLPETTGNGAILLNVSGDADIDGATVHVGIEGASTPLRPGDSVVLVDAAGTLSGVPANATTKGEALQGLTFKHEFTLGTSSKQLTANILKTTVREERSSLSESYLSTASFLDRGSDFLVTQGMSAMRGIFRTEPHRPRTFVTVGGGQLRYGTDAHVNVRGETLVAGLAGGKRFDAGDGILAGVFEYGTGSYDSANDFASGRVKGRGQVGYKGLGLIGSFDFANAVYLEGSLRGGKANVDYRSDDILPGQRVRYDTGSSYVAAHLGGGRNWTLNASNILDTYLQALWTHQASSSTTLSTGSPLRFNALDSERLKLGARVKHGFTDSFSGYVGLAYDHEFAGQARATENGLKIATPNISGGTGVAELGLSGKPTQWPLYVDFGLQAYAGKREGATANLRVSYLY
jgi:hypothetical protein